MEKLYNIILRMGDKLLSNRGCSAVLRACGILKNERKYYI